MISGLIREVNLTNLDTMGKYDEIYYIHYKKENIRARIGSIIHGQRQYWITKQDDGKFRLEIRLEHTTSWEFLPVGVFENRKDAEKVKKILRKHDASTGNVFNYNSREASMATLNIDELCCPIREVIFPHLRKRGQEYVRYIETATE